ncbi:MAG TPA: PEP-CTERM sorting domain-containing protein [Caulobacteraceae bacterium]|jgi:hypothetical protein|nr:PEP-CTERM sorting domain-containing protein [Caulobacteraceae bacterium]
MKYLSTAGIAALALAATMATPAAATCYGPVSNSCNTVQFATFNVVQRTLTPQNPNQLSNNAQISNGQSFTSGGFDPGSGSFVFGTPVVSASSAALYSVQFPNEGFDGNSAPHPGSAPISFSFVSLSNALDTAVTNVPAEFELQATSTGNGGTFNPGGGPEYFQSFAGSFAIYSTTSITLGATTYGPGTLLLGGTFNDLGVAEHGGVTATSDNIFEFSDTMDFYSALLDFSGVNSVNGSENLAWQASGYHGALGLAASQLSTVAVSFGGSFASDPRPAIFADVPEPSAWALMVMGVGSLGANFRRRRAVAPARA